MFSKGKTIQIFQTTPPPENPSQLRLAQALGSSGIAGTGALPTRSVVSFLWRHQLAGDSKQNLTNGILCLIVYSLETSYRCTVNSDYITTSPSCPAWPTPTWILSLFPHFSFLLLLSLPLFNHWLQLLLSVWSWVQAYLLEHHGQPTRGHTSA